MTTLNFDVLNNNSWEQEHEPMNLFEVQALTQVIGKGAMLTIATRIAQRLQDSLEDPLLCLLVGTATVDAINLAANMADESMFLDMIASSMEETAIATKEGKEETSQEINFDWKKIERVLIKNRFAKKNGKIGAKLHKYLTQKKQGYAPIEAGTAWERRFPNYGLQDGQGSPLLDKNIEVLEKTLFTTDTQVLGWADGVQKLLGGKQKDKELYVLEGARKLDPNKAYHNEFKVDDRAGRCYQASCHAGQGAGSDRSRALMSLVGVKYTKADVPKIIKTIKNEILDLVNVPSNEINDLMIEAISDPVNFIASQVSLAKVERRASKPWSFTKAAHLLVELLNGGMPYIGMAFGKDAKCSGAQLTSLMAGCAEMAAACGFSLEEVDDAYERSIQNLIEAGFEIEKDERNIIKKVFMAIFYGQQYKALMRLPELKPIEQARLIKIIFPDGVIDEELAKKFHNCIVKGFGEKINIVRNRFLEFKDRVQGKLTHKMPDGATISMDYRVELNALGEKTGKDTINPDVIVRTGNTTYRLKAYTTKTSEYDSNEYVRKGFVNMVQGTDALIARLVAVNLDELGATHVINIHDCFRVNVMQVDLLDKAIIKSYQMLFGNYDWSKKSKWLPLGNDILALYFEGVNKSVVPKEIELSDGTKEMVHNRVNPVTQFIKSRKTGKMIRKFQAIKGIKLDVLIDQLGRTTYFS